MLVVSDSRTEKTDKSGKLLVERLTKAGHLLAEKCIVHDNVYKIRSVLSRWIADSAIEIIITSGGTGLTGRDGTPEAASVLFDKEIEGFGELFRWISYEEIASSTIQSRVTARCCKRNLHFLPSWLFRSLPHRMGQNFRNTT